MTDPRWNGRWGVRWLNADGTPTGGGTVNVGWDTAAEAQAEAEGD